MGIPLQPLNIPGWAAEGQQTNPMLSAMQIAQGLSSIRGRSRALQLQQQQQQQQQQLAQQRLQQQAPLTQAHTQLMQAQLQGMPAQQELRQAQAASIEQQLANPDLRAPGMAGQYGQLEYLRRHFGKNSRQYQQLKNAMEQQQAIQQQMADARTKYAGSSVYRALPAIAKKQGVGALQERGYPVNIQAIMPPEEKASALQNAPISGLSVGAQSYTPQGRAPLQPQPQSPQLQAQPPAPAPIPPAGLGNLAATQASQMQSNIAKDAMGTEQIKRLNAANRGLKALTGVSELGPAPFKYSGLKGKTKLQVARILQSSDPIYKDFIADNQAMKAAEQDLAVALGVAKTDSSFKEFLPAFDIFSWANNPEVAKAAFNSASKLMRQEGIQSSRNIAQQRQDIMKPAPQINLGRAKEANGASNMVRVRSPQGTVHLIPKDKVDAAKKAGGTIVG